MVVVLIPAYKPDEKLVKLVDQLHKENYPVLIVDDGSGAEYASVFAAVEGQATVVHAEHNLGKGGALKLGMQRMMELYPDCKSFLTVDADGQHKLSDVRKVRDKLEAGADMVLTMRALSGKIPLTSFMGNTLSRWVYTLLTGRFFWDNQSGLRGFRVDQIDWLMQVSGEKYDYELNELYYADIQHIKMEIVQIETVYIDDNASSHFHPFKDTVRLYIQLFSSAWPILAEAILYQALILTVMLFFGYKYCMITIPVAGLTAASLGLLLKTVVYRKIHYRDGWRLFFYDMVRTSIYATACSFLGRLFPELPLLIGLDCCVLILAPIRYMWHQLLTDRNRRRSMSTTD